MSKIDFGIIFIAKESELDARNLYLDIDSVFFSVDEVIKTGRYKDTNLSDLKMVNVKFETTVNTNAIKLFDTKLFQIINGDYTSNIDEKLESLVNYCTNLDFNKIKIENNFIERPTNSMNFNKEKKELPGCKERIDWHFLKYMITFRIKKRRKIEENINKIAKEKVIIFYKRKELNKWLADIQNKAN